MNSRSTLLLVAALLAAPMMIRAQQPAPNAPLELPDFLVTGKAIMDIAGGAKQTAQKPMKMGKVELDSLNPTEKFPTPLVPNRPLPTFGRRHFNARSYADILFGSYVSPSVVAGHSLTVDQYYIDVEGRANHAQQWQPGAFRTDVGATLSSSYVAPEKFLFFGKGLTETDVSANNSVYSLFADSTAPVRSTLKVFGGVKTEAFANDVPISAGISWNSTRLNELSGASRVDSRLHGDLSIKLGGSKSLGLYTSIDAQALDSSSYPFIQLGGTTTLGDSLLRLELGGGIQYATSTKAESRIGAELMARASYFYSGNSTFSASLRSGLRRTNYSDLLFVNPYMTSAATIDVPYDIYDVQGSWKYHPTLNLQAAVGLGLRQTEREVVWQNADVATFRPMYRSATSMDVWSEILYSISDRDKVAGSVRVRNVSLDSNQVATYVEPLKIDVQYIKAWSSELQSTFFVQYVGKRRTSIYTNNEIDAFLNIAFSAKYALSSGLSVSIQAENLINSSIMLWNGYRERGIFVAGGITWRM